MADYDPFSPENISSAKGSNAPAPSTGPTNTPDANRFQSYMSEQPGGAGNVGGPTPAEVSPSPSSVQSPTLDTLLSQSQTLQNSYNNIQSSLKTPNLKLKRGQEKLLGTKLANAQEYIEKASKKIGAQTVEQSKVPEGASPIVRFLSYVTDGQKQMRLAQEKLEELHAKKGVLKPTDMMLVQVKLSQAQQELEYSSILLSKVVEVIKQMMNIQI